MKVFTSLVSIMSSLDDIVLFRKVVAVSFCVEVALGLCIHWIGSLEWTTGLEHWTIQIMFSLLPKLIPVIIIVHLDHAHFIT